MAGFLRTIARHFQRIEGIERLAIVFALAQDGIPTQAGLRAFQDQEFEEGAIVMNWNASLVVVILDHQIALSPVTAFDHHSL